MTALRDWLVWRGTPVTINGFRTHVCAATGYYPGFAVVQAAEGLICCRMEQEQDGWLYMEPEGIAANRVHGNAYLAGRLAGTSLEACQAEGLCRPTEEALGKGFAATFKMEQRKNDGRAPRVQVVTYSDDPAIGVFCELLLPGAERLSIVLERDRVSLSRPAPGEAGLVLWESGNLAALAQQLSCPEPSPGALLSALKDLATACATWDELERKLPAPG